MNETVITALLVIYEAARRLLTPEQCAKLTEEEEKAFGLIEDFYR